MITRTKNADGTITIVCDEDTDEMIWGLAYLAAEDTDNEERTRRIAAEVANATPQSNPAWRA